MDNSNPERKNIDVAISTEPDGDAGRLRRLASLRMAMCFIFL